MEGSFIANLAQIGVQSDLRSGIVTGVGIDQLQSEMLKMKKRCKTKTKL